MYMFMSVCVCMYMCVKREKNQETKSEVSWVQTYVETKHKINIGMINGNFKIVITSAGSGRKVKRL